MTSGVVLNFSDDPTAVPEGPALSANVLVAAATETATLEPYGRAVWPAVRDAALGWRRSGTGVTVVRSSGRPDSMWWAAVDGAFEARGGVVDMIYRALVIDAVLRDRPGPVMAQGHEGDPWLAATSAACRARSRDLTIRSASRPRSLRTPSAPRLRRASLLARRTVGALRGHSAKAEVLVVLAHGRMARRTPSGRMADVYTKDFLDPLATHTRLARISLESPAQMDLVDLAEIATGAYRPWLSWCSLSELRDSGARREAWAAAISRSNAFSLVVAGIDLGAALEMRAVPLAARGLAVAELYTSAFRRALEEIAPRAIISTEGHSNVGRVLGQLAPTVPLIAPQAGIIGPDGVTNAAYDHRGLEPLSADGRTGCPLPTDALVWGPFYAEVAGALGHDAAHVTVSGLPRVLPERTTARGGEVLYVAGANDDVCAFASGFDDEIATIRALAQLTSAPVRVRLHPLHDGGRYRAALDASVRLTEGRSVALAEDLDHARVVTGRSSTALLESAVAGWPVVILNLGSTPDLTGFGAAGLPLVEDRSGIAAALAGAEPTPAAAAALAWPRGGEAIGRVVDCVVSAAGQ